MANTARCGLDPLRPQSPLTALPSILASSGPSPPGGLGASCALCACPAWPRRGGSCSNAGFPDHLGPRAPPSLPAPILLDAFCARMRVCARVLLFPLWRGQGHVPLDRGLTFDKGSLKGCSGEGVGPTQPAVLGGSRRGLVRLGSAGVL